MSNCVIKVIIEIIKFANIPLHVFGNDHLSTDMLILPFMSCYYLNHYSI